MYVTPSTPPVPGNYTNRVKTPSELLVAYEMGGVGIQDPSQGLLVQLWQANCYDGQNIFISAPNTPNTLIVSDFGITEIDLAFDQNMFPFITYVAAGLVRFYWFDPTVAKFVISTVLEFAITPRCTLDDKRAFDVGNSDIQLFYINLLSQKLVYRIQRERYQTEHVLSDASIADHVRCVNFADTERLQWTIDNYVQNVAPTVHNGLVNHTRPISVNGAFIT